MVDIGESDTAVLFVSTKDISGFYTATSIIQLYCLINKSVFKFWPLAYARCAPPSAAPCVRPASASRAGAARPPASVDGEAARTAQQPLAHAPNQ